MDGRHVGRCRRDPFFRTNSPGRGYFDQFKSVAEVASVVRGEAAGRDNSQQRILVYNIGLAIHDIYFANKILSQLPIATDMELDGPNEKMWLSGRTGDDICRR